MTLRKKTLIMIGATLLGLVLILFASSELILINGINDLEKENVMEDVMRAENVINHEISNLDALTEDWASWDDSYAFVNDLNQRYIDSNLANSTFNSLKLNLVLFLDTNGNVVYVKTVDSDGSIGYALPHGIERYISNSGSLVLKNSSNSINGLIDLDNGPMMVSARPILTSNGEGPVRGTLIMGRYLNTAGIGSISNITQLSIRAVNYDNESSMTSDLIKAKDSLNQGQQIAVMNLGTNSIAGYTVMNDIQGNPSMILRVNESRAIFTEAQNSIFYFVLLLVSAGIIMGLSILIYLDKAVLSRLYHLTNRIGIIGSSKDFSARVSVEGDDELSDLSSSINKMMERLETSHVTLFKSKEKFRQLTENIDEIFWIYDVDKANFSYISPAFECVWGYKVEEIYQNSHKWLDYVYLEDKERVKEFFDIPEKKQKYDDRNFEYRITRPDGEIRWLETRFSLLNNEHGQVMRILGVSEDITGRKKKEKELQNTKNRLNFLISATPAIIYTLGGSTPHETSFISANVEKQLGYSPNEFLKDPYFWTKHVHPADLPKAQSEMELLLKKGQHYYEYRFKCADGTYKWIRDEANVVMDKGKVVEIAGYWIDISKRKKAEKALKKSERIYRTIFENTGAATVMINSKRVISLSNSEFEKLSKYSKKEIEGKLKFTDFIISEEREKIMEHHNLQGSADSTPSNYESKFMTHEGAIKDIMVTVARIPGTSCILASILDITDRKKADDKIRSSLKEKEVLLQELHHRVKNNLQVISSLLSLQSRYIKDDEVLELFKESQNRVKSMTLVHEKLYQSQDLSQIDLKDYIHELSSVISHSYAIPTAKVSLLLDVDEIALDLNTAIPLGLIITELLTNSLKYAFPQGYDGKIKISLHKSESGKFILEIEDNGVGIPDSLDIMKSKSLGLRLVRSLTEQIGGTLEIKREGGTKFKIIFGISEFGE